MDDGEHGILRILMLMVRYDDIIHGQSRMFSPGYGQSTSQNATRSIKDFVPSPKKYTRMAHYLCFQQPEPKSMKLSLFSLAVLASSASGGYGNQYAQDDDDEPKACVSLLVHPDTRCKEDPIKTISFRTWTKPGSPCYTNDKLIVSVKDQYCSAETGNWHQTLYPKDGECGEVPWWLSWIFPQEQVYTPDGCILGFDENGAVGLSLKSCQDGPCDGEITDLSDEAAVFALSRSLRA